jgi:flagellar basal-body rod modification protein FlgD
MMITPASTAIPSPRATASDGSSSSGTTGTSTDPLAQEQTFLKLLVAQVQNQDPMDPTADPTQYVTQLAQFSSLEQLTQMRSDLDTMASTSQAPTGAAATSSQENN